MAANERQAAEIDTILLKVASRCNINCSYCYVYHMGDDNWSRMSKFMEEDTIDAICWNLAALVQNQKKVFSIVLHGGEPFLLGLNRLNSLLSKLRNVLPYSYPVSIQTNGLLISNEILDICSRYRASVAVSIDGPKAVHDKLRVGHDGKGTFDQVMAGISLLKEHPDHIFLNAGLLAVIDPASDPTEVYRFFKHIESPSVDFLYKDGNHDRLPEGKSALDSLEYGHWMSELLAHYLADPEPLPIRVIDDMLKVLLGGLVSKEGLGLTDFGILIIDTDGTITKNDTLKSAFNGADQFLDKSNIRDTLLTDFINTGPFLEYKAMQRPANSKCLCCPQLHVCGGGMILHRWSDKSAFNNPSVYCADQLYLIDAMRKAIFQYSKNYA